MIWGPVVMMLVLGTMLLMIVGHVSRAAEAARDARDAAEAACEEALVAGRLVRELGALMSSVIADQKHIARELDGVRATVGQAMIDIMAVVPKKRKSRAAVVS
jgi:hypothetical protein